MKRITFFLSLLLSLTGSALAGESSLAKTWQPLMSLGESGLYIREVTCHQWNYPGPGADIHLIGARNVPPTDDPEHAKEDINLASIYGLVFEIGGADDANPEVTLNTTKMKATSEDGQEWRVRVLRASLECVRRVAVEHKLKKVPLALKANDADKPWLEPIIAEFNKHDLSKPFAERPDK
ncbi:hypothetical protein [Haloferula sp. BvORR071]|uniref:hypothetical protein n=1 Tax=Haloferula sp. BvORR071 TaxID=1396141 RepID=UPI00055432F6|nr:hypothetical protein [Haloferula sp. BvORR071]